MNNILITAELDGLKVGFTTNEDEDVNIRQFKRMLHALGVQHKSKFPAGSGPRTEYNPNTGMWSATNDLG